MLALTYAVQKVVQNTFHKSFAMPVLVIVLFSLLYISFTVLDFLAFPSQITAA